MDVPPERREDGVRTPRKRQAEQEVFIGTPERGPEPRSRVRQVHSPSEVQGMASMPSMPVRMRGSSSVPVGSPLINAPWISTQGGTTFGVTPEVWQQMQQQSVPQQPVRPQPDPVMMFMQQQSQQNALMMEQMMQMTTAVVQALNGLSAGAPPGGGKGGVLGGRSGGGPPAGASFGGVSSSGHGGGGSSTSFPAEGKMPFNVNLPVCAWREWNTRYKELVGFRQWLDQFSHWLNLIDTRFPGELREAMRWTRPLTKGDMDPEAYKRSFRLLSFLKQSLSGFDRAENVFQHYQQTEPLGETHGYEALRRLSLELSIKSRGELMQFKEKFMSLTVGKGTRVMDIVRHVETQASQYAQVLSGPAFAGDMSLTLPDADKVMVIMRLLPD